MTWNWSDELPIVAHRDAIADAIDRNPVVVICGETGSGKSTQLPKICLEAGRGINGLIGQTQPRRIAARTIAARIAEEMGTPLGQSVGYKVRFSDHTRRDGLIKVMTDGILLAETQGDRQFRQYDTIIIDEAHERSLNIDFLLGYLKQLLPRRRDLKVVITSATLDPERLSAHFDNAPIIEVSGRTYPVEVRYAPLTRDDPDERDLDQRQAILAAVDALATEGDGDMLVFLSGEREIKEIAEALRGHHPKDTSVLPLYARLSVAEQNKVFKPHPGRRIVLATNVAETSLTVPGIRFVIDPGLARISRYSARSRVQRLPIEPISQASARQRAGRCGRLGPGICVRLYAEDDFAQREPFTPPEILRTNLASVILQMAALRLGDVHAFPFVEAPRRAMIRNGYETLHELGAIDDRNRLTDLGRQLARLPIDPRLGRMILAAVDENCLTEVLTIAAALSVQDPRERPMDRRDAADAAHRAFADEASDFVSYLNLWKAWHDERERGSWSQVRKWCTAHFVSFLRMREWIDIRRQLHGLVTQLGHACNREPASYDAVHRALLAGLLSNVGVRGEKREFTGARETQFHVFPGSALFKKPPRWVMAAEIVETTRRYARCVARIQPEWIERVGEHLLKRSYSDPHWEDQSGRVMAWERITMFGLEIVSRRRAEFSRVDPVIARDLFIHHALVEGALRTDAPFLLHNQEMIATLRTVEAKRRRRDVVVDAQLQHAFYDRIVPADVCSSRHFEQWRRRAERGDRERLFMREADLTVPGAGGVDPAAFPDTLAVGAVHLPLRYTLDPGGAGDGVTLDVPLDLLRVVPAAQLEWLVPGMLEEKIIALLRTLPKRLRRNFVPAPDVARRCLEHVAFGQGSLTEQLGRALVAMTGIDVAEGDWDPSAVPDHLRMRVCVHDGAGDELAAGRDLAALQQELGASARESFARLADARFDRQSITSWDFEALPEEVEVDRGGMRVTGYPALVDDVQSVSLRLFESREVADASMRDGVRRLYELACAAELAAQIDHAPEIERLRVLYATRGSSADLDRALATLIADRAFVDGVPLVRDAVAFGLRLDAEFPNLWEVTGEVISVLMGIFEAHQDLEIALGERSKPVWRETVEDERAHAEELLAPGFLLKTPWARLKEFPRYLNAAVRRLEKLTGGGIARDRAAAAELATLHAQYVERRDDHAQRGIRDATLDRYRWLIEEYRVSLFAQDLGTAEPVSPKRLARVWDELRTR